MNRLAAASTFALLLPATLLFGQAAAPANQPLIRYGLMEIAGRQWNLYIDQLGQMERALTLSDDQHTKIKADVDAMNDALDAAQEDAFGAPTAGGGIAHFPNQDALKNLQAKLDKIASEGELKILSDLPEDQRLTWAKAALEPVIKPLYDNLKLTPEQLDKTNTVIAAAAKELVAAKDAQSYSAAQGHMIRKWIGDVLTDEQATRVLRTNIGPSIMGRQVTTPPRPPNHGDGGLP